MNLINLTPHTLNIHLENGTVVELPPTAPAVRCSQREVQSRPVDYAGMSIPVSLQYYGDIENIPEPLQGVGYIVSRMAAEALLQIYSEREDIFIPGPAIRDGDGKVIGCRGLSVLE